MTTSTLPPDGSVQRSTRDDRANLVGSTAVDLFLEELRKCVSDLGWTFEALAEHCYGARGDRSYVRKVLFGEKPCALPFLLSLPTDVLSLFYARQAERLGHVVVAPVDHETARRQVISGLCALLAPALPAKAGAPLKVTLGAPRADRRAAR